MWQTVFDGRIEARPVIVKVYDDGDAPRELRVVTNYGKDEILGDGVRDVVAGAPVSAADPVEFDASSPDELAQRLTAESGFSAAAVKEIVAIARPAWLTDDDLGEEDGDSEDTGVQYRASRLVRGTAIAGFDHEIVDGLKTNTVERWPWPPRMQIAIRNEAGEAYRTIGVDDMDGWLSTLQWFLDRGYTDELGPHGGTWKGCDAVFSRPR